MRNYCVSEAISLGKPENFTLLMHIMTCFEVPVNLYGAYCILFKTPKKMESVKWHLLTLHFICSTEDLMFSFGAIPYLFLPVCAGFPLGAVNAPIIEFFIIVILLGDTGAAILAIFENRYYIFFGKGTRWRHFRKFHVALNFLLTPIFMIPVYLAIPDQETALRAISQRMLCNPMSPRKPFVLTLDPTLMASSIVFLTVFMSVQVVVFCSIAVAQMFRRDRKPTTTSRNTLDLQRKFLIALGLQMLIPLTVLIIPIFYIAFATALDHYSQSTNNLVFSVLGSHGSLSTIIMVFVHSPYRKVTLYPYHQLTGHLGRAKVSCRFNCCSFATGELHRNRVSQ